MLSLRARVVHMTCSSTHWLSRSYWLSSSPEHLARAEQQVLSVVQTPFTQTAVDIGGGLTINTLLFGHSSSSSSPQDIPSPVVLLHGFGAACGMWSGVLDGLSSFVSSLYAIDLLGFGRSSRPTFTASTATQAEDFFVESLESWRKQQRINRITLAGHSLGGYLGAAYACKYPEHLDKLILISPVGVADAPVQSEHRQQKKRRSLLYSSLESLWLMGVSPQQLVKLGGSRWGRGFIDRYVSHRFADNSTIDKMETEPMTTVGLDVADVMSDHNTTTAGVPLSASAISDYIYHLCVAKGSGEFALNKLLRPDLFAYQPIGQRIVNTVKQSSSSTRHKPLAVSFIYGSHDWYWNKYTERRDQQGDDYTDQGSCLLVSVVVQDGYPGWFEVCL